jgi:class 3 adenylate cyclase
VLFADVVGSTGLGERLPLEELKALIGECTSAWARAVEAYGGYVQAYMGDGICVYFGVPAAHEDDPERAARAALQILDVMRRYATDVKQAFGLEGFSVRVGINTGRTAMGLVGGADPQIAALGDTTNVAARLQSAADPGTIAVGEATAARLKGRFVLEPLGPIPVKGRDAPVPTWRLVGAHPVAPEAERLTPLTGRGEELTALRRCLEDLRVGRGQVLCLVGEAGLGKSRLLAELRSWAERDLTWLHGRCLSYGTAMAYWPFLEAFRGFLGVADGEAEMAVRLRLRARLTPLLGHQLAEVLPYLGRLLGVQLEPEMEERVRYLPPEALAEQVHRAYGLYVEALAAQGPVVIAIEDLHWADPSTRALAEALLPLTERAALLVATEFRPETTSEAWRFRLAVQTDYAHRATEMHLRPLDDGDARQLVSSALAGAELEQRTLLGVLERAQGNPLYLEQLLAALLEAGHLEEKRVLRADPAALAGLPPAVEGLLVARIDRLPPSARRLAQVAAVAGRSFLRRVLERVADDADLDADLGVLMRSNLVRELRRFPELEYIFTQNLAQEAAAATLTRSRRRELHGRVAGALETLFPGSLDDYVEILAHHYGESDDETKALHYAERAGERAAGLYANTQALEWWEKAAGLATALGDSKAARRVTRRQADLLARIGECQRAVEIYRQLAAGTPTPDEAARILAEAGWIVLEADDFDEAARLVDEAAARQPGADAALASLELVRARSAHRQGRYDEMATVLERLEQLAAFGLPAELDGRRMLLWDLYHCDVEDFAKAEIWEERLLTLAEAEGDQWHVINAQDLLACTKTCRGDLVAASELGSSAYLRAQEMGYLPLMAKVGANLLYTYYLLGALDRGKALGEELRPRAASPRRRVLILVHIGWLKLEAGQISDARACFREALETARAIDVAWQVAEATIALAAADVLDGHEAEVEETLEGTLKDAEASDRLHALRWLAELSLRHGDAEKAERRVRAGLGEHDFEAEKVPLWRLLGMAQEARENGSGREALEQALDLARTMGRRIEEGRALIALARAGLASDAAGYLAEARAIFASVGAQRDLAELA